MFGSLNTKADSTEVLSGGPVYTDSKLSSRFSTWPYRLGRKNCAQRGVFFTKSIQQPGQDMQTSHGARSSTTTRKLFFSRNCFTNAFILLTFSLPVVALALVLRVPKWYSPQSTDWANSFTHCDFNGHFSPYRKPSMSLWDRAGFFYINVAWGTMTFPTAKFIDIVWDIVVGRGGQTLLAWVTYKVSSQYLVMTMREAPVSYITYGSLAFVPPTFMRIARSAGELRTSRDWWARLITVWILLSFLFVLSFSTLASAMSGYTSNTYAVMSSHAGEAVLWADYQIVQFVINDAWRIGEPEPVTITVGDSCIEQGFNDDDEGDGRGGANGPNGTSQSYHRRDERKENSEDEDSNGEQPWQYVPSSCALFWRTVQYVNSYGIDGSQRQPSTFTLNGMVHNLSSPTLNITTSYTSSSLSKLAEYLENFSAESPDVLKSVSKVSPSTFWIYENETYSFDYVLDHASCRYGLSHTWGFSFLLMFITSLLLAVWAVGTYTLWLYVQLNNAKYKHDPRSAPSPSGGSNIFRSSWDLVEAMKRDLGPDAVPPEMGEKEIRHLLRRRNGVGPFGNQVGYPGANRTDNHTSCKAAGDEEKHIISPDASHRSGWDAVRSRLFPPDDARYHGDHEHQKPAISDHTNPTLSLNSQTPILASFMTPRSMSSSVLSQLSRNSKTAQAIDTEMDAIAFQNDLGDDEPR